MFRARMPCVRRVAAPVLLCVCAHALLSCAGTSGPGSSNGRATASAAFDATLEPGAADRGRQPIDDSCPRADVLEARAIEQEAACLLARYVQIDTSNPPGNELSAALFLARVLERDGVRASIIESVPGRANLVARLSFGSGRAIALAHHMDVVPAVAEQWTLPPFGATVRDGMLWGRGALDDKAGGIASLLTLLMVKRLGIVLPYDLVFIALADEEAGGGLGARFLLTTHRELLRDVAYVLNEGGGIMTQAEGPAVYQVEVAQKAPLWLRLVARGTPGHGASPTADMSTARLSRALARLADYQFPIEVLPAVQALYAQRADSLPEALREGAHDLRAALKRPAFAAEFMRHPHHAALVHNTLAITELRGSDKENVIPAEASAVLDLRLLPGQEAPFVIAEVTRVIADPGLEVESLLSWVAHSTSTDTPLFQAIEAVAQARDPGALVLPNVIAGFTDCNAFRASGIACYGFMPLRLSPDAFTGMHGNDERVSIATLGDAVLTWIELLRKVPTK